MPDTMSDIWWLFSRQTVTIRPEESILKSALLMTSRNFRHLPVIAESGRLLGLISAQDIIDSLDLSIHSATTVEDLRRSLDIPVERIMSNNPVIVEPGDGLAEVTKKFCFHNFGALPVVSEDGIVQGIVTLRDLVGLMGISSAPLGVRVSEIMNTNIITISPQSSLSDAIRLMSEKRIRRLPIVSKGILSGVLTNKDILRQIERSKIGGDTHSWFQSPVSELMTRDVITIGSEDDIRVAANRMMIFGVGGLAISELPSGEIALVTERDLIKTLSARRTINFLVRAMQYELEVDETGKMRAPTND